MPPAMPAIADHRLTSRRADRHRPVATASSRIPSASVHGFYGDLGRRGRRPDRERARARRSWCRWWFCRALGPSRGPGRSSRDTDGSLARGRWAWKKSPARSAACRVAPRGRPRSWNTTVKPPQDVQPRPDARGRRARRSSGLLESAGRPSAGQPPVEVAPTMRLRPIHVAGCRNSDDRADNAGAGWDAGGGRRLMPRGPDPPPSSSTLRPPEGRGRTRCGAIARHLGMGGKDLYWQARAKDSGGWPDRRMPVHLQKRRRPARPPATKTIFTPPTRATSAGR